jgi:hypothetical protein|tara:strand:- start:452 stop:721 length:270 start_codon:yes stop_codon:yes gene_type:complete
MLIGIPQKLIRHVLNQILNPAAEMATKPINVISTGTEATPVDHLRQRHPVDARTLRNFGNRNPPPFFKLPAGNHLFDFETQHIGYIRYQ